MHNSVGYILTIFFFSILFLAFIMWAGDKNTIKYEPYGGPYYELKELYNAGDVGGYNDLIIKYNFDPAVLRVEGLPEAM